MITSLQINEDLIRQVREIRRRPDFVHPCEGFRVEMPRRKAVRRG
jgi:hypothetical protein